VSVYVSFLSMLGKGTVKCIPLFIARQRLGNTFLRQRIHGTVEELLNAYVFMGLYIPLFLLGNSSVKTFPRQRKIAGGVVFYATHVVSKASMRLFLTELLVL
jgi:hypothetical protein